MLNRGNAGVIFIIICVTDADEAKTPMEALLFSFGVGIGVMCTVKSSQCEIDRLNQLLKAAQAQVQILKEEVKMSSLNCTNVFLSWFLHFSICAR
jgi:hypothetical protein